ncbi:hypothetical protein [Tropicimonas sp. IMCC6043]|uniref:hypothetical protein n=1 Tax=Tropicimonas sp. IMCC6043 TaxID=2510645 RepID=UPI00101CAD72|nr:hypothetical protein [Tropicimonas sp. IMCC6043]RYH10101.1 hypothetical protein EU800_09440 [Tropicimonas sp. IMCC6043]
MSILRPILTSSVRPAALAFPVSAPTGEETILYLLGADGQLTSIDAAAQAGTVLTISDLGAALALETTDAAVLGETTFAVTLEFGD